MKTLYFECKLLSDVVMTQKSATEGHHRTLDFIPGNNFLGIVAKKLYADTGIDNSVKLDLFHSGKVRFGDAHPALGEWRTLRGPASVFYPKLSKLSSEAYVYYRIPDLQGEEIRKKQLKQCRNGFFAMTENEFLPADIEVNYAIKSAYDKEKRRSENEKMYGYQSLGKGRCFYFQVEIADENLADYVVKVLEGRHGVGRSKTAEYGLVDIRSLEQGFRQCESTAEMTVLNGESYVVVYADSRLIFWDETGMPTLQPTAEQLGVRGGCVDWRKSQVRSFQYAPFNSKRRQYDADRYGIEKGSVFVVRADSFVMPEDHTVGGYKNEGFGKVIYNPTFLHTDEQGRCLLSFKDKATDVETQREGYVGVVTGIMSEEKDEEGRDLLKFLRSRRDRRIFTAGIYTEVEKFVGKYRKLYGDDFASQWGTIRKEALKIAMDNSIKDNKVEVLEKYLFGEEGYLLKGVASREWNMKGRLEAFRDFVREQKQKACPGKEGEKRVLEIVINLAAQMAKKRI